MYSRQETKIKLTIFYDKQILDSNRMPTKILQAKSPMQRMLGKVQLTNQ